MFFQKIFLKIQSSGHVKCSSHKTGAKGSTSINNFRSSTKKAERLKKNSKKMFSPSSGHVECSFDKPVDINLR